MDVHLSYLEDYLREEFSSYESVRIRVISPAGTQRSIDLPQDYDAESSNVHRRSGVLITTPRSQYFFPKEWTVEAGKKQINSLVAQIRTTLE